MLMPSQYPEVGDRPALRELLAVQVDMQVADLGTLLCLPRPELGLMCGCNLTATTLAATIIAGASVLFWRASPEAFTKRGDRGQRFQSLVKEMYPWSGEDAIEGKLGARLLWDLARNPLSHTLGVGEAAQLFPGVPNDERGLRLAKAELGLEPADAEAVMSSPERPAAMEATIASQPGGYVVHVATLAWGLTRTLRNLFADAEQAGAAEGTARWLLGR
jgi:hypothetical protein